MKSTKKTIYLSKSLRKQLTLIHEYPISVLHGGSGFGKTTAIWQFLTATNAVPAVHHWYTCYGGPVEHTWQCICDLLAYADEKTALQLKKIVMPSQDWIDKIALLLANLTCEKKMVLVIDNYHLSNIEMSEQLIAACANHQSKHLHIIFITQNKPEMNSIFPTNPCIHFITQNDLLFQEEDIFRLFSRSNNKINSHQAKELFRLTGGWIAALKLNQISYQDSGCFLPPKGLKTLIDHAIWNKWQERDKILFLRLFLLDSFTEYQAAIMIFKEGLTLRERNLLKNNAFIHFDYFHNTYQIHSLLRNYLMEKFSHCSSQFQYESKVKAGDACLYEKDYVNSAKFYCECGLYQKVLQLPYSGSERLILLKYHHREIFNCISRISPEILMEQHSLLLKLAIHTATRDQYQLFRLIYDKILDFLQLQQTTTFVRKLKSMAELLNSFIEYNDIIAMSKHHKKAVLLWNSNEPLVSDLEVWTSYWPTVAGMIWRESGSLITTLTHLKTGLPFYQQLTNGHGTGADIMLEADIQLLSGNYQTSEVLCYNALYRAEQKQQDCICFCSEFALGRIALLNGNPMAFKNAVAALRQRAERNREAGSILIEEMCISFFNITLGLEDEIPQWFWEETSLKDKICKIARPFARIIQAHLLRKNQPTLFEAIIHEFIKEAEMGKVLLPQIYFYINWSIHKLDIGFPREGIKYLKIALNFAIPDQVYLPFAEYFRFLYPLLKPFNFPDINIEVLDKIQIFGKQLSHGIDEVRQEKVKALKILTPRQREVALLAKKRYSTKKIAEYLFISPHTVNTILKEVYKKLDIHSREELEKIKF